jgi:Na+:H+ antiporter, NhaA family
VSGNISIPRGSRLGGRVTTSLRRFLPTEAGTAAVMLVAAGVALLWANSRWSGAYESLWHTQIAVDVDGAGLTLDLEHWVGDGLMMLFFLVVGLEVRRELSMGQLTERRLLVVPLLGALGGMALPALLFLAIAPSGDASAGWGIVIATDTALVLGALALVGPALSTQLRLFLLSVAVVDDVVAVGIIGVVYSERLDALALAIAGASLAAIALLAQRGVWRGSVYALALLVLWVATVESGLHPSIAGMLAGLLIAGHPARRADVDRAAALFRAFRQAPLADVGHLAARELRRSVSVNERLHVALLAPVRFVVVPLFVFANAGVDLGEGVLGDALASPLTWAVVIGLTAGKLVGIGVTSLLAARLRLGPLPQGVGEGQVLGGAALSGIGFTVSLLITHLAFDDSARVAQATVGVLFAAVAATLSGWLIFRLAAVLRGERTATLPKILDPPVDPARDHVRGYADAPLTLVEYADFECVFCGQATGVVDALRERFGADLRYVFRHLPQAGVHRDAQLAAEAAEAAAAQGAFWEMHDRLYAGQDHLEPVDLLAHAAALGLDLERFSHDLGTGAYRGRVEADVSSGRASGALGTPTFFVNGLRHIGRYDEEQLAAALSAARPAVEDEEVELPERPTAVSAMLPVLGRLRNESAEPAPLVLAGLDETPDVEGVWPRLRADQIASLTRRGERRRLSAGEPLFGAAGPSADFVVVLSGALALVDGYSRENRVRGVHGQGRFLGGLGVLTGEAMLLTPVAQQPSEVLTLSTEALRAALDADVELREVVLRTLLLRRAHVLGMATARIIGSGTSEDALRLRAFLVERDVLFSWHDLDADELAADLLRDLGIVADETPVVITRDRRVLRNPTDAQLSEALGLESVID